MRRIGKVKCHCMLKEVLTAQMVYLMAAPLVSRLVQLTSTVSFIHDLSQKPSAEVASSLSRMEFRQVLYRAKLTVNSPVSLPRIFAISSLITFSGSTSGYLTACLPFSIKLGTSASLGWAMISPLFPSIMKE